MRLLLVHQNFPGQFRDLAPGLCELGHEVKAIAAQRRPVDQRIEVMVYNWSSGQPSQCHRLTAELDEWLRRAELVGEQAMLLKRRGWAPDVMLAHPGWGEALLLKTVFPHTPLVIWPELWLKSEHLGIPAGTSVDVANGLYLRIKDWLVDGAMADADRAIVPTQYQARTFPERWQNKITVLHEGVPETLFATQRLKQLTINEHVTLTETMPVVTFISRNLEPMRGFPEFMRALPQLQRRRRDLQVVIVGGDELSYSGGPADGRSWKDVLLQELEGQLDRSRLHLFGRMPHQELIKLYCRSDLHVYLSQAFVLSWSLLEVMACSTPVLAMDNPMMREVIDPGVTGWLTSKESSTLADTIAQILDLPESTRQQVGQTCRQRMLKDYPHSKTLKQLNELLTELGSRAF
jgi:glycosyltransferase involved in cell wall biosynthesis